MLSSLFAGLFFFGLTVFAGFLRVILKAKKWKPPLNIGSWKVGFATFLVVFISGVYVFALFRGNAVLWGKSYTGYDLFNAVNAYRKSIGVREIRLNENFCNNLVSRWNALKEGKMHDGFEEWVEQVGLQKIHGYTEVGELLVGATTPAEAISNWLGSPGHKLSLENEKWTDGCAYASDGYGVVVTGTK